MHSYYRVKVKGSRYRPGVAQRVGRGVALLFHDCGTRRGRVLSSTPRPHFTPGKDPVPILQGTAVAQWLRCCAINWKIAGSIPASVCGFFIGIKSFRSHYGPGVDSASNRNEYQEHFVGVKSGRCVRLTTLSPSCAVVMKSGNLNFLEPCGPLQACNGTALPLPYPFYRRLGGPQGRSGRAENLVPTGIRSRTVQPVVSRYTD